MQQKILFTPEERLEPLNVDPRRTTPVMWIRRLVILSRPSLSRDALIQSIPFHRGLNIIRTEKRNPDDTSSVAHDVGKTLLMRLLRYTLGDEWFASKDDMIRIRNARPECVVVAEWFLGGELWSVVRPLSDDDAKLSFAIRGTEWSLALNADDSRRLSISSFVERVEEAALSGLPTLELKGGRAGWMDALGWIARDCGCGFRKTAAWRDREVNPKGIRETKFNKVIMQWLMGLMSEAESAARGSRDENRRKLKEAEKKTLLNQERLQALYDSLAKSADFATPQFHDHTEALSLNDRAEKLRVFIQDKADDADSHLKAYEKATHEELNALRLREIQLEDQKSAAIREAGESRSKYRILLRQYDDEVKRETGPRHCPAKEECAWLIEIKNNDSAGRMDAEGLHLGRLKEEISVALQKSNEAAAKEKRLARQFSQTQREHSDKRIEADSRLPSLQMEVGRWASLATQAGELSNAIDALLETQGAAEAIQSRVAENENLVTTEKDSNEWRSRKRRIQDYYTRLLTRIFGDDAEGIVVVENGLRPTTAASLHAHGTALSAMARVIAFELSCMLASMCGVGAHPRLLMHDGPREGEMEAELVRILFRTVSWLESISPESEAAFQYIMTTADAPEEFSKDHPAVVHTLHGRSIDGLLLKKRF